MKLMRIFTLAFIAASIGGGIYIAKPQSLRPHPKEVHLSIHARPDQVRSDFHHEPRWFKSEDGQYRKRPDELWIFHARRQTDYICVHSSGFTRLSAPCG